MDTVFLENVALIGKHGVADEERNAPREFHIDVVAEIDTGVAVRGDDLEKTANYVDFLEAARKIVEGPSVKLIETLGERIAKEILKNPRVRKVAVTVRKPGALETGVPGVTITQAR